MEADGLREELTPNLEKAVDLARERLKLTDSITNRITWFLPAQDACSDAITLRDMDGPFQGHQPHAHVGPPFLLNMHSLVLVGASPRCATMRLEI